VILYDLGASRLEYRVDSYDDFVIDEIWNKDEYFLSQLTLPPTGAIVDVGAHIGAFVARARALYPGNPIVAVEPEPANRRLLRRNVIRNRWAQVEVVAAAVVPVTGATMVYLDPTNTAGHSTQSAVSSSAVRAEGLSLDDLFLRCGVEEVALLKIDCEGGEYPIVLESNVRVWDRVGNLALEYHPVSGHGYDQLCAFLRDRGFEAVAHKDGYMPGQGTVLFRRFQTPANPLSSVSSR
jgi:FkbM family methyltransferase